MSTQVRITWNGKGGELDAVTVDDTNIDSIANALAEMVRGNVVSPGDSFTVEEIEP